MSKPVLPKSREIVTDGTPVDAVNLGSPDVALTFKQLARAANSRIHMSQEVFDQRVAADRRILGSEFAHVETWGGNSALDFNKAMAGYRASGRLNAFPPESRATAALALYLQESTGVGKVELLTTNRQFADAWVKAGGKLARDFKYQIARTGKPDYARTRSMLQLPPLAISENGYVYPVRTVPVVKGPPSTVVNGPRTTSGSRTTTNHPDVAHPLQQPAKRGTGGSPGGSTNGRTPDAGSLTVNGKPVGSVPSPGKTYTEKGSPPSGDRPLNQGPNTSRATAKSAAMQLGLQGLNRAMHLINDYLINEKIKDAVQRSKLSIESELRKYPDYGAMILVHFSKRPKVAQEKETESDFLRSFRGLTISYGHTREDAMHRYQQSPGSVHERGPHETPYVDPWLWIEPKEAFDPGKLDTPFPAFGLAKFVDGLEELTKVQFATTSGFDDKMKSRQELGQAGRQARFLYLQTPAELTYQDQGQFRTHDVNIALARAGVVQDVELKQQYIVPVVNLDSRINPYDAVAAMIYPADSYTAGLFALTRATDSGGLLLSKNPHLFKMVRWVKPHKIEVIRHFNKLDVPMQKEPIGMWGRN